MMSYASEDDPKTMIEKTPKRKRTIARSLYDLSTPTLDKHYRELRKRIRFPRYYKKALNW